MLTLKVQSRILMIHGSLAFWLGLALFYLRSTMTNRIFEVIAVGIAILLAAVTLILAAVADWFAAWNEGIRHLHRSTFYLFAGLALAIAGVFLGVYSEIYMPRLVFFAGFHALAFGITGITAAWKTRHDQVVRRAMYLFGALSLAFSVAMIGAYRVFDNRSATAVLGAYLCFVAAKLFFLVWALGRGQLAWDVKSSAGQRTPLAVVSSSERAMRR